MSSSLDFPIFKMGIIMLVPHRVVVTTKWDNTCNEFITGPAIPRAFIKCQLSFLLKHLVNCNMLYNINFMSIPPPHTHTNTYTFRMLRTEFLLT